MIKLNGRKIFVVGGSRGLGRAAAVLAAKAGADVAFTFAQNESAARETCAEIAACGQRGLMVRAEITSERELDAAVDEAVGVLGGLDGLVVSAGIFEKALLSEMTLEFWNRTVAVNLTGTYLAVRACLPHLRKFGRGASIVIYTSTAGQGGSAGYSAYATTKGGQIIFMRSLAKELGPEGIRANCVAPAWTETDLARGPIETIGRDRIIAGFPLGRIGQPRDVAGATIYLLSDLAEFVTGTTLTVDGGKDMRG